MLKSMRNVPVPQPPALSSARMMPSDEALLGSVETSTFHALAASKRPPGFPAGSVVVVVVRPVVPQAQSVHGSPFVQSAGDSQFSPVPGSMRPSPQVDATAPNRRRFSPRAPNVAVIVVQAGWSTFAFSRTRSRSPHVVQRAWTALSPRLLIRARARTSGQPLAIEALPSASTTMASNGSDAPGTSG